MLIIRDQRLFFHYIVHIKGSCARVELYVVYGSVAPLYSDPGKPPTLKSYLVALPLLISFSRLVIKVPLCRSSRTELFPHTRKD